MKKEQNESALSKDDFQCATDKINELEKLVGQLLGVNESLVKQMGGAAAMNNRRPFMSAVHAPKPANPFVRASPYSQVRMRVSPRRLCLYAYIRPHTPMRGSSSNPNPLSHPITRS